MIRDNIMNGNEPGPPSTYIRVYHFAPSSRFNRTETNEANIAP